MAIVAEGRRGGPRDLAQSQQLTLTQNKGNIPAHAFSLKFWLHAGVRRPYSRPPTCKLSYLFWLELGIHPFFFVFSAVVVKVRLSRSSYS